MSWSGERVDVVVLASGVNKIPLYDDYEAGYKALVPLHGKASIEYVLEALSAVPALGRVCIVGPRDLMEKELASRRPGARYEFEEGGDTFLDSILIGLRHFQGSRGVLFVTGDLPLLTPGAVTDFLAASAATKSRYDQNLYVSAVPETCYTGPYVRFPKPFNRYRDVSICHGNLFLAEPALLEHTEVRERIDRMYRNRKNGFLTALALGFRVAITYIIGVELLHVVSLRKMTDSLSRRFGFGINAVLTPHPEITIDVDEPDDYEFVRERIEARQEPVAP